MRLERFIGDVPVREEANGNDWVMREFSDG